MVSVRSSIWTMANGLLSLLVYFLATEVTRPPNLTPTSPGMREISARLAVENVSMIFFEDESG